MKEQSFPAGRLFASVCAVLVLLTCQVAVLAQNATSSVQGVVTDPQGNVVAGATVTLSNAAKNFNRTQTTTDAGVYAFTLIPPDEYTVEVQAAGFKKALLPSVRALVSKPTELNIQLEIGNVSEVVTVSAGAGEVLINKQDATLGNNFVNKQITQLPLEARSPLALVTLQPGVTREGYVAGARADQSNLTLDGVDINDAQTNAIVGTEGPTQIPNGGAQLTNAQSHPVIRLNAEAIEEFRVTTTNANANQAPGAPEDDSAGGSLSFLSTIPTALSLEGYVGVSR